MALQAGEATAEDQSQSQQQQQPQPNVAQNESKPATIATNTTNMTNKTSIDKKEKPLTKIIVRRLPPAMTREEFVEQISPVPDYDYLYHVKGDMSLGENAFSRAYINFCTAEDVFTFKEKFDNYVFVDVKGHEYPAVVEFAAFQKIPKRRSKFRVDPKCNTIEVDPIYLEFLESLKEQPADEEKPEFSYQPGIDSKKDIVTTPLLEYIKQRRMDKQRIREEKREERKRREVERKRIREEDRRKRKAETNKNDSNKEPSTDAIKNVATTDKVVEKMEFKNSEKSTSSYKRYEDKKTAIPKNKPKISVRSEKVYEKKTEYTKKEPRKMDAKKDEPRPVVKKVKKYSERREERKIEAQKAEKKTDGKVKEESKEDATGDATDIKEDNSICSELQNSEDKDSETSAKEDDSHSKVQSKCDERSDDSCSRRNKENDPRVQRRIRNKDRPAMQIYQPGMLSKKKQPDKDGDDPKD